MHDRTYDLRLVLGILAQMVVLLASDYAARLMKNHVYSIDGSALDLGSFNWFSL